MVNASAQRRPARRRSSRLDKPPVGFNIFAYGLLSILALIGVLPFWLLVSGSFTENGAIIRDGYNLWPTVFSADAYRMIFQVPEMIVTSYGVSIFITIAGSFAGLLIGSMTAFVLSRQDFKYRNYFSFYYYIPGLFSGGLIPYYLMMKNMRMEDNYLALILPGLISFFHIVVLRSFFKSLPDSIGESGKVDGANDFTIYWRLYIPMAVPALATVSMFLALAYWNSWMDAMLFISNTKMYPLQFQLYQIISKANFANQLAARTGTAVRNVPTEAFKLAMVCVSIGPIILLFPYIRRYFIKGLTVGAVKG